MHYPYITVQLQLRQLQLHESPMQQKKFPIAIGKESTPTPCGRFHIYNKKILTDSDAFGTHWLGLNVPGYGIHGTNRPSSIGTAASNGCIRMHNHHIQYVFQHVVIGTTVFIED